MTSAKLLSETEIKAFYASFPSGRPMSFFSNGAPGGFSLVAFFVSFFEKIGLCEKTPEWVKQDCKKVQEEKQADGSLTGTTKFWTPNGSIDVPNRGDLIRIKSKDGDKRIVLLLDPVSDPLRGWLVAAWDAKTGEPCQLSA